MAPHRVQLRRTRGWRMPEGAVKVDRTTRWGNPFRDGPAEESVARYAEALGAGELAVTVDDVRAALAGRDLACWCPADRPCHADVLLGVANGGAVPGRSTTDP